VGVLVHFILRVKLHKFALCWRIRIIFAVEPLAHRPCHFEDSDHRCWQPWTGRGVCAAPADGSASALVQHADQRELCKYNPPHGFRALCRAPAANATLRMLRALRDPAVCRYRSCAVVGSGGGPCGKHPPRGFGQFRPPAQISGQARPGILWLVGHTGLVIHTGGGLLGARYGGEIDAHDAVIRLNPNTNP
jgi:hypothetical protein